MAVHDVQETRRGGTAGAHSNTRRWGFRQRPSASTGALATLDKFEPRFPLLPFRPVCATLFGGRWIVVVAFNSFDFRVTVDQGPYDTHRSAPLSVTSERGRLFGL